MKNLLRKICRLFIMCLYTGLLSVSILALQLGGWAGRLPAPHHKKIVCYEMSQMVSDLELHGLYSSPSIVRVIKARRMRWAGHVACMGEVRGAYNILVGRPEGRKT
jgi:hypothetical protein